MKISLIPIHLLWAFKLSGNCNKWLDLETLVCLPQIQDLVQINYRSFPFFFPQFEITKAYLLWFNFKETKSKLIGNVIQYPIHSLLVFYSDKKAIPVAWIIAPKFSSLDAHRWMRALYNRVHAKDPTSKLACFIVDDPSYDVLAIRLVQSISYYLS